MTNVAKMLFYVEILRQLKVAFEENDFENLEHDSIIKAINKAYDVSDEVWLKLACEVSEKEKER